MTLTLIGQCPMSNSSELFSYTIRCSSFKWIEPLFFELSCTQTHTQTDRHTHRRTWALYSCGFLRHKWHGKALNLFLIYGLCYVMFQVKMPAVRRPEAEIGESAYPVLPYRQFWYHQVENTLGQLFSVSASQSRIATQVKRDIKLWRQHKFRNIIFLHFWWLWSQYCTDFNKFFFVFI